jgi:hypothetical protein
MRGFNHASKVRPGVRIWLAWLAVMSTNDAATLFFGNDILNRGRWHWVNSINNSELFWGTGFAAIALFSALAVAVGGYTHARIALGLVIPLHIIFGLSLMDFTLEQAGNGSSPGLVFTKWFTTAVVSTYLLTRPLGVAPPVSTEDKGVIPHGKS